jgi:energy-coupling factor transporter ATP-binding protein EcfA2
MLHNRPLYDNDADAPLFVEPPAWQPLIRAIDQRLNILLSGARGAGKTTLLRQVQLTLRERQQAVVYVDATAVANAMELTWRIRRSPLVAGLNAVQAATMPDQDPPPGGASRVLYDALQEVASAPPTRFLVDASASGEALYELFGRLRDPLWQQHHTWVVAIDEDDRATVLRPPADAFFEIVLALAPMSEMDLARVLSLRSGDTPSLIRDKVAHSASGNPRAAIRALGEAIVNDEDPSEILNRRGALLDSASDVGRPHGMLMAELLDRGQASPSDPALQRSLGLSRARLTDYLRDLLHENLVIAEPVQSDKPGRPRTIYRPALD